MLTVLQPKCWKKPKGYANGMAGAGEIICVAGQIGWNEDCVFVSAHFPDQVAQALKNIVAVLNEAGAKPSDIARMTWYITDKQEYLASAKEVGAVYREIIGNHYPAMTAVEVKALIEDQAKIEIEVTAIKSK